MESLFCKVYISAYSLMPISNQSSINDFDVLLEYLDNFILGHKCYNNIHIECTNDIFDYEIEGNSLEYILLEILNFDYGIYSHYLSELQKIVGEFVKYNNTLCVKNKIISYSDDVPLLIPVFNNRKKIWGDLELIKHTSSICETLKINSDYVAVNSKSEEEFIDLCKKNYIFLDFHDDIADTLKTIKIGRYLNYINLITHSLNVLNQAYSLISTEANKNLDDLNEIMILSDKLGKRLECTRQSKNKVEWEFQVSQEISLNKKETVNCEYHLKIDEMDDGREIPRGLGNPVRIYFGLKTYKEFERKKFKIAHIGMHL